MVFFLKLSKITVVKNFTMSSNITSKKRFYEQQLYHASSNVKIDNEESWKRLHKIFWKMMERKVEKMF